MGLFDLLFADNVTLNTFRTNPSEVDRQAQDFQVDVSAITKATKEAGTQSEVNTGGRCEFFRASALNNITTLEARISESGGDYWFPYIPAAVGYVAVPEGAPKGTIVGTAGMNGCSLVVTRPGDGKLYFCHDPNGEVMFRKHVTDGDDVELDATMKMPNQPLVAVPSASQTPVTTRTHKVVFHRKFNDYAGGPLTMPIPRRNATTGLTSGGLLDVASRSMGETIIAIHKANGIPHQYAHHLVSVKTDTGWDVYNFCILTAGAQNTPVQAISICTSKKLGSF